MFDFAGLFSRDSNDDDANSTSASAPAPTAARPANYVVRKDGKPFAILNATPALAQRTIAGFMLATPAAHWSYERA
jgi:hypothetical protein